MWSKKKEKVKIKSTKIYNQHNSICKHDHARTHTSLRASTNPILNVCKKFRDSNQNRYYFPWYDTKKEEVQEQIHHALSFSYFPVPFSVLVQHQIMHLWEWECVYTIRYYFSFLSFSPSSKFHCKQRFDHNIHRNGKLASANKFSISEK